MPQLKSLIAALMLFLSLQASAQQTDIRPSNMQAGGLLLHTPQGYVVATQLNTDVDINVNGLVARVSVRQEFRNTGSEWVEGTYVFPLPDKAAVDHMRLHIGERFIEGEIREKEEARKAYEKARAAGKKATLVEQQRANLFTTSVANIGPGEKIVVEIEYLEDLRYDSGTFGLRFPMTLTPRYIPGTPIPDRKGNGWSPDTNQVVDASLITPPMVTRSPGHKVRLRAWVNAGVPLDIIASRYHPVSVTEENGRYAVELVNPTTVLDHDFEMIWRPVASSTPRALSFAETVDSEAYYLLMLMPPDARDAAPARLPREMIFIIDTSGSMHGTSIVQAKQALQRAMQGLQPGDRFNVVEFNSILRPLFPGSVDANQTNLSSARRFVAGLNANGGTEMRPALEYAMSTPISETHLRQIVFITDGSVGNEEGLYQLIESRLSGARLFTVGIGSAPNSWFMRKSAELGRGTFTIISAMHEVGEKMDRLFRKLESPQVTDIQVTWPNGAEVESYPATVPDLYHGEPVVIKVKASSEFADSSEVTITGQTPAGQWQADMPLKPDAYSHGVGALWARARISSLLDDGRRGADPVQVRKAIVSTALTHHLVSKYTSLVAVDKTPVRPASAFLNKEQVPNLLPHGQSMTAGFPATATNSAQLRQQGLAILAVALLALLWQRRRRSDVGPELA